MSTIIGIIAFIYTLRLLFRIELFFDQVKKMTFNLERMTAIKDAEITKHIE